METRKMPEVQEIQAMKDSLEQAINDVQRTLAGMAISLQKKPKKQKKRKVVITPEIRKQWRQDAIREKSERQLFREGLLARIGSHVSTPRDEMKRRVFERYGYRCNCCGESNLGFLTVDHIGGGGTKHRRSVGALYYQDIYTSPNPEKFQLLCMNCNWATRGGRTCPHNLFTVKIAQ